MSRWHAWREDLDRFLALARPSSELLYRDAHYLWARLEVVSPSAMRRFLPAGLRLAEPARADLFCAFFPECSFGSVYREAGLFVHVRAGRGRVAIYCPWMIVDDDVALILGRELLGYPKKMGVIGWERTGAQTLRAVASRRGRQLVSMEARLGERIDNAEPFLGRAHRNVIGLLGVAAFPRLLAFTPRERAVEVREVALELEMAGSERDPLHEMGLGSQVLQGCLHRVDIAAGWQLPLPLCPVDPTFLLRRLRSRVF